MIKTYSKKRDGDTKLSESFRVREFACKDGSNSILIDMDLVIFLQRIRNWAGAPVTITSGYRTPSWNKMIGGAEKSKHIYGMAADIIVSGKSINQVATFAEAIGMTGIERNEDKSYVHVDTRPNKYYWRYKNGRNITVTTFGGKCPYDEPTIVNPACRGDSVRWLQWWLRIWGYDLVVDGIYGEKTADTVRDVQKRRGLIVDGIAGGPYSKTRSALRGF